MYNFFKLHYSATFSSLLYGRNCMMRSKFKGQSWRSSCSRATCMILHLSRQKFEDDITGMKEHFSSCNNVRAGWVRLMSGGCGYYLVGVVNVCSLSVLGPTLIREGREGGLPSLRTAGLTTPRRSWV